jgi:hypothetical protein
LAPIPNWRLEAAIIPHSGTGKRAATLVAAGIFACQSARLSQPQHVRQPQNPWNFVRSFGNPGCCGWDTRAPFHLGNTPSRYADFGSRIADFKSETPYVGFYRNPESLVTSAPTGRMGKTKNPALLQERGELKQT